MQQVRLNRAQRKVANESGKQKEEKHDFFPERLISITNTRKLDRE